MRRLAFILGVAVIVPLLVHDIAHAHVDEHVDLEAASTSTSVPGVDGMLYDNGDSYELTNLDQGSVPGLYSGRRYMGANSLRTYVPAASNASRDRSEVFVKKGLPFNRVRFTAFAMYISSGFPSGGAGSNSSNWLIFSQWHQPSAGMPPVTLEVKPQSDLEYQLVVRNDDTGDQPDTAPVPWPVRMTGPLERGQWVRFTIELKFDPSGTNGGYVKLYKNGSPVYTYSGKVGYSGNNTVDWRVGIYRTGGYQWPSTTIYFDEMRYGDNFAEVQPGGGTTFVPVADTLVRGGTYAGNNYGAENYLMVKNDTDPSYDRKVILKFSFGSVTQVTSARLRLRTNSNVGQQVTAKVYGSYTDSWQEMAVTSRTHPPANVFATSRTITTADNTWYDFDVTSFVTSQMSDKVATFVVQTEDAPGSSVFAQFYSRETSADPQLVILQ